jgi:hypothetical protein
MQQVYLPAFYLGVHEELEKYARCWSGYEPVPGKKPYTEDSCRPAGSKKDKEKKAATDMNSMPVNENILPSINSQAKWKYVRTKDGLKLTDGNLVYSFGGFPDEYPAEDARVSRMTDDNILNFENDALSKGTAQIHRSSPDNIYMTLATGAENPTFMLQHEGGQNWRYSPSKKFLAKLKALKASQPVEAKQETISAQPQEEHSASDSVLLDPTSFMDGAKQEVKKAFDLAAGEGIFHNATDAANSIHSALSNVGEAGKNFVAETAAHPISSLVEGYAMSRMLGKARDIADPSREVLRKKDPVERTDREIGPMLDAALPVALSSAIMAK